MKKKVLRFLRFICLEKIFVKKLFFNILEENLENSKTILELGAGKDSHIDKIKRLFKITAIDQEESYHIYAQLFFTPPVFELCIKDIL